MDEQQQEALNSEAEQPAQQQPSAMRLAAADMRFQQFTNGASLLFIFGMAFLVLTTHWLVAAAVLLGAGLVALLAVLRVRSFRAILMHGREVSGQLRDVSRSIFPRRGRYVYRIAYVYTVDGLTHQQVVRIVHPAEALALRPGDHVPVLVHPAKRSHALVPLLYTQPGAPA
jgi:uncharacterized protein (DUF58 family)